MKRLAPLALLLIAMLAAGLPADEPTTRRVFGLTSTAARITTQRFTPHTAPAKPKTLEELLIEAGLAADMADRYAEMIRANPDTADVFAGRDPRIAKVLEVRATPKTAPMPLDTVAAIEAAEEKNRLARKLVGELATVEQKGLAELEGRIVALGGDAMVPLKLAELSDSFELRKRARGIAERLRWRLACSGTLTRAYPNIIETMSGPGRKPRADLVNSIVKSASFTSIGFLAECLADQQDYVRQRAVDGLAAVGARARHDSSAAPVAIKIQGLLEGLLGDDDRNMRLLAIGAMMKMGNVNVSRLADMLDDDAMEVRTTIVKALGYSGDASAIKTIVPLLNDPQWRIRAAAMEAISKLVDEKLPPSVALKVLERLDDEEDFVRALAAKALSGWKHLPAAPRLLELVKTGKLSEEAGFASLGAMKDAAAKSEMFARYRQGKTAERRAEVLSYLNHYESDSGVDSLFRDALKDESLKSEWHKLIILVGERNSWESFFPMLCEFLTHEDDRIAEAAWSKVSYRADEKEPPAKIIRKLLASGEPMRGKWGLLLTHSWNGRGAMKVYRESLAHSHPEVVAQALGLIAKDVLGDGLEAEMPSYRRSQSKSPPPTGKLPEALAKDVIATLASSSSLVRVRAAAMLYLSARTDAAVVAALRKGLASKDTLERRIALAGVAHSAKIFLDDIDIEAMARNSETSQRALVVIASLGGSKYMPVLIELAGKADHDNGLLMKLLIKHGGDEAIEIVVKKFREVGEYQARYFAEEHLKRMPGAGPVKFIKRILADKKTRKESYIYAGAVDVLITLPDPSAKEVLEDVLKFARPKMKSDWSYREIVTKVTVRLAELDPAGGSARLKQALGDADPSQQEGVLNAILTKKPTKEMEDLLFEAALAKKKDVSATWRRVVRWTSDETFRKKYLPAIDKFAWSLQAEILQRAGGDVSAADLDLLATISVKDIYLREYHAGMVGALTSDAGSRRPVLAEVPAASLPALLIAAGDWADAPEALAPYLNDARAEVAAAAREGLAYYIIGRADQEFTDAHRAALLEAMRGPDPFVAYLAAEAVGVKWPDELRSLDLDTVKNSAVIARAILARGKDLSADHYSRLNKYLAKSGRTATRLSLAAAVRAYGPSLKLDVARLANSAIGDFGRMRRLAKFVALSKDPDMLKPVLRTFFSQPHRRRLKPLIPALIAEGRKSNPALFITLVQSGWIDSPTQADVRRLFELANTFLKQDSYGGYESVSTPLVLTMALNWTGEKPDETISKKISEKTSQGVLAAAVAWLKWNDDSARKTLLAAATLKLRKDKQPLRRQQLALAALALKLTPADAKAMIKFSTSLPAESWRHQQFRRKLIGAVAGAAPKQVLAIFKQAAAKEDIDYSWYELMPLWRSAQVMLVDEEKIGELASMRMRWGGDDEGLGVIRSLLIQAQGALPTTMPATLPAPAAGAAGEPGEITAQLLPPWGEQAGAITPADPVEAARKKLKSLVKALQHRSRTETAAGDEVGALPPGFAEGFGDEGFELVSESGDEGYRIVGSGGLFGPAPAGEAVALAGLNVDGLLSATPEYAYLSWGEDRLADIAVHVPADEIAAELRPLLKSKSDAARKGALRLAAAMQVAAMADDIAGALTAGEIDPVEAAWALASLRGPGAAGVIEEAYGRQKDFTTRVRLACLLRLLGSEVGRADIDRALALWTIRRFRMIFIDRVFRPTDEGYSYGGMFGPQQFTLLQRSSPAEQMLLPWREALLTGAADLVSSSEGRFVLPGRGLTVFAPDWDEEPTEIEPKSDISTLKIDSGLLVSPGLRHIGLPLDYLVGDGSQSFMFARLCAAEQDLEPHFFVQFADQATDLMDLRRRWLAWWAANRDKPREQWLRQAVDQAVAELTHKRWWHRCRAVRRLMRLTGRNVTPPGVFDLAGWRKLQGQWRDFLAANGSSSPAAWLLREGVRRGTLPAGTEADAGDPGKYRAHLIRLAGFAPRVLSEAALLQLQAAGVSSRELAAEALSWRKSPRRSLAGWVREQLHSPGRPERIFYSPADLKTPTTAPATK